MSFFSRLFGKKKAQPAVAEKKAVNLEALSLDALVSVIQGGEDEQVRIAAIQKITDQPTLLKLAAIGETSTVNSNIQKAARQRIAGLIDSGAINGQQLSQTVNDKAGLFALFGLVSDSQLFEDLFSTINDENELTKYALEGATSKLRQRAAEKITDKDLLQQLLKNSKTRDKTVFKIVKEKCDAFKEEDKRAAELLAGVTNALQALEQHSNRPYDGQYTAKFGYLQQQWDNKKENASAELIARAQTAIAKAQETIDSISAEERAQEAQRKAEAQADLDRQTHIQQLQSLLASIVSGDVNVDETFDLLRLLDAAWKSLSDIKKPSAAEQKTVAGLHRIITEELNAHRADGSLAQHHSRFASLAGDAVEEAAAYYQSLKSRVKNLTTSFGNELPEALVAAQVAYESWEKAASEKAAELQSAQRQIAGLIRKANETVSAGVLGKAMGIRRAIDEKLQNLDNLPNHLANQLEQLDETLSKLQDWKNYAVVPKKHELIAQLEALENSSEHPETLATKIKRLQDEWKALSKGGKDQEPELWEKFHELAQKVYQPCRDYFAEQANVRQQNLNSLKQLVAQLKDYLENHDWANANWKDVGKVIRVARQEWRSYSPTERVATQPVQAEFENVLAAIQQKLNEEFARNDALKRELIAQAQQLVTAEDVRKAAEDIKQLQARWQTIGASLRKDEQQLWREFRDQCDAVFARRQQQSNEFKAELEANLNAAKGLVEELNQLAGLAGQPLNDARKRVDEIRQAFGTLGQFPKAQVNDIKTAFQLAIDKFEQNVKAERQHIKQQIWVNLLSANNALRQYELALVNGDAPELEQLQVQIEAITHWPAGGQKAIQQKIARVTPAADLQENLAALRELCIRAEILTDSPTPASEQALRTAFQVNQLQQNFGRKSQGVATEFENMMFEWVAVGAVATDDYEPLVARFNACRLKALE